ncbi:uncharacterized protein LOC143449699 isoform X2 [Clavelina lepadiformis]|uniref:Uncharacterized protein n=1 Tax=Clavelina lepadiformis TaxID=159417 RepID=A0ABP0GMB3_CLALP
MMFEKVKQVAMVMNIPLWVIFSSLVLICLVIIKLVQILIGSKSSKKRILLVAGKEGAVKSGNKKKRSKRNRPNDISSQPKSLSSVTAKANKIGEANTPTPESGHNQPTKKFEKKKAKSKKKKNQVVEVVDHSSIVEEGGEWQTVDTKEQKSLRRERKKQDSADYLITSVASKLPLPSYSSVPSMAKNIAPRFAQAAGETWQDGGSKRQSGFKPSPVVNRTPMVSTILEQSNWLPSSKSNVPLVLEPKKSPALINNFSTSQATSWTPMGVGDGLSWPSVTSPPTWIEPDTGKAELYNGAKHLQFGDISPSSLKQDGNFILWEPHASQAASKHRFTGTGLLASSIWQNLQDKFGVDEASWDQAGELGAWKDEAQTEDWVHVSTPTPTQGNEDWVRSSSMYTQGLSTFSQLSSKLIPPAVTMTTLMGGENFVMEPEGYSVSALVEEDPWNMDISSKDEDWNPPEALWSNPNDEWKVAISPTKHHPTYFEESSDSEKVPTSSATQQSVVGAGATINSTNQSANKKPRRRRRKKQTQETACDEEELRVKSPVTEQPVEASADVQEWSTPGKKKRNRPRKAE